MKKKTYCKDFSHKQTEENYSFVVVPSVPSSLMLKHPQYVGFLNSAFNLVHMAWHLYMDFGGWYTLGMLLGL
jgi:hypothetical protein